MGLQNCIQYAVGIAAHGRTIGRSLLCTGNRGKCEHRSDGRTDRRRRRPVGHQRENPMMDGRQPTHPTQPGQGLLPLPCRTQPRACSSAPAPRIGPMDRPNPPGSAARGLRGTCGHPHKPSTRPYPWPRTGKRPARQSSKKVAALFPPVHPLPSPLIASLLSFPSSIPSPVGFRGFGMSRCAAAPTSTAGSWTFRTGRKSARAPRHSHRENIKTKQITGNGNHLSNLIRGPRL
jgi:hypothetical protein